MKGFRVEGRQLGAAQTTTMAHPGECRHFGHPTNLHHNTQEDPGFGGPIPVTAGLLRQKWRPSRGFGDPYGYGGGGGSDTRRETIYMRVHMHTHTHVCILYIYIYIYE